MRAHPIEARVIQNEPFSGKHRMQGADFSNVLRGQSDALTPSCERGAEVTGSVESGSVIPDGAVVLGTISPENPTISNLLIRHPVYGKNCWNIIHSEQNRGKPYTRVQSGANVYLDPKTLEIRWNRQSGLPPPEPVHTTVKIDRPSRGTESGPVDDTDSISERLVGAVKQYLGKPYEEINCYELLVEGLKDLGIRYRGIGGLAQRLVRMAAEKGLPENACLNGEGLIAASGSQVYFRSINGIRNSDAQAREVIQEMEPLLKNGYILSFSTPTRGHTGIVSRKDIDWTFINSGRMDHSMETDRDSKGVGEESLHEEIRNWFRMAARRGEPLQITLGCLNEEKLALHDDHRLSAAETV